MENENGSEQQYDLSRILSSENRDYLVRNNGDRVELSRLKGKVIGIYFSASWCGPCRRFTPTLVQVYNELTRDKDFEIVFSSGDKEDASFDAYFSEMPWLAIPFSDSETREKLGELFSVAGIPHLVFLDENGNLLTGDGVEAVREYGSDAFPFTSERIAKFRADEEEAKRNQSLKSLLVSKSRDYVIAADGSKVPVSELQGKTVCLYFSLSEFGGCKDFNPKLIDLHKALKQEGENFEIVMIPLDDEEEAFQQQFENLPWLSLPAKDKISMKLAKYFELAGLPTVVVIGPEGKTIHSDVAEAIEEHGVKAYPFTPEKFSELEEFDKAKREAQTLESILVLNDSENFVVGKDGIRVPVSNLSGKTVLLYFSAHWCPPCRAFLPALIKAYEQMKEKGNEIEVIFISSDRDQQSFDEFFSTMPWLALPFGDRRKESLGRAFKVRGIPTVIAIGPNGKTLTTEARELITSHGAGAYPFTAERLKEIEAEVEKLAEAWPKEVMIDTHAHNLQLTKRRSFFCDGCGESGQVWSFYCSECDYDLHPNCALESNGRKEGEEEDENGAAAGEGWVCDGEKCFKE